jgi:hypothetical protein
MSMSNVENMAIYASNKLTILSKDYHYSRALESWSASYKQTLTNHIPPGCRITDMNVRTGCPCII